jgi:F-type H+-transporting ATPase subunit epsilon
MADTIHLELVTPERRVFAEDVDEITAQAVLGQFGVLPGHANLLALLQPGELVFIAQGKRRHLAVAGGFAQVSLDEGIRILAEAAEFAEEIDVERAKTAKERAEKRLGEFDPATQADDLGLAEAALHRALVRLQVAEKAQV